jgi:hypothetical protein
MADVTMDLMFEVLKSVQKDVADVKLSNNEIKAELQAVRTHLIGMQQDTHNIYATLARHELRLDRIDRRLELFEPAA